MPLTSEERPPRGSLAAMMMRRFESYKSLVVRPFFNEHFARLDRQIVLVDVLGAINRGGAAVADLERAMTAILKAFRPGANSWLSLVLGRKIDRVLFAATKADHLPASSHERLDAILEANRRRGDRAGRNRRRRSFSAGALGLAGNARDDGDARTARRFPVSEARPSRASASAR